MMHAAATARATREDVAAPGDLERLDRAVETLKTAVQEADAARYEEAAARLHAETLRVLPPPRHPRLHEWVEIAVVALGVAMAFRCYFLQPFKIPTASMMPTLYGVTVEPQEAPAWYDRVPFRWVGFALFGETYEEVRARSSGAVEMIQLPGDRDHFSIRVGGVNHRVRLPMRPFVEVQEGQIVNLGQRLVHGRLKLGDQVFVNRIKYNFMRPRRGEIIVFDMRAIAHPQVLPTDFYIKRLVGLPGETIELVPPYVQVDGQRLQDPPFFRTKSEDWPEEYRGYVFAQFSLPQPALDGEGRRLTLAPDQFLPMGDNTRSSLDGRYFGGVPMRSLVGPASMVYWPLSPRWGLL